VSLAFSPDGRHLLATSRDRSWSVTRITSNGDGSMGFGVCQREEAAHARIIWDGAWTSPTAFLTASRDATLKHWTLKGDTFVCERVKGFEAGVTAIAYHPSGDTVAVGLETGSLLLFRLADWDATTTATVIATAAGVDSPSGAIHGLAFRPGGRAQPVLACVSEDRSLRLYRLAQEDADRRSF
jgi:elongator complex protein 2